MWKIDFNEGTESFERDTLEELAHTFIEKSKARIGNYDRESHTISELTTPDDRMIGFEVSWHKSDMRNYDLITGFTFWGKPSSVQINSKEHFVEQFKLLVNY